MLISRSYGSSNGDSVVFPFHENCLNLLAGCFTGVQDTSRLDKDALYDAMCRMAERYTNRLALDYGDISGQDQCWNSIAGEEVSLHPIPYG